MALVFELRASHLLGRLSYHLIHSANPSKILKTEKNSIINNEESGA
jgi:hypothetical protein